MDRQIEEQVILARDFIKEGAQHNFELSTEIMAKLDYILTLIYTRRA